LLKSLRAAALVEGPLALLVDSFLKRPDVLLQAVVVAPLVSM